MNTDIRRRFGRLLSHQRVRNASLQLGVSLAAVLTSFAVGAILIAFLGKNPLIVYAELLNGVLVRHPATGWYGLGQVMYKATTLIFTGVAVALSFRAGLFNIGAEGQLYLGGFAAALAGLYLVPEDAAGWWPPLICTLAAFIGGALGAVVPAVLKAWRGAHEVIVTIMMNFVIVHIVNWANSGVAEPETVHTYRMPDVAMVPQFRDAFPGSAVNASFWISLVVVVATAYLLTRTRTGYEMRAVGAGAPAAEAGGVKMRWMLCLTLLVSGGLAGLGGINFVLGNKGYFEQEFTAQAGFMGIAVALLARNNPLGVVPAAFLFAVLSEGAVAVGSAREAARVPREVFEVLQAIIILSVVGAAVLFERWFEGRARTLEEAAP